MSETETETETETTLATALTKQLFYLRAIFVLGMAIAVMTVAIAVTPMGSDRVTAVGTATTTSTPAVACPPSQPWLCTYTGGSGGGGTLVPSGTGGAALSNDGLGGGWVPTPACTTPTLCTMTGSGGGGGTDPGAR